LGSNNRRFIEDPRRPKGPNRGLGRESAQLLKIYLLNLLFGSQWHPSRPVLATVSDTGLVHIWVNQVPERWAAYAPGFEELSENKEYIEAEDEFDVIDAQTMKQRKQEEQNVFVDILSMDDSIKVDGEEDEDPSDGEDDFVPLLEDDEMLLFKDNGPAPLVQRYEDAWEGDSPLSALHGRHTNQPDDEELLQVRCSVFLLCELRSRHSDRWLLQRSTRRKGGGKRGEGRQLRTGSDSALLM
jgi:hypothetical protein